MINLNQLRAFYHVAKNLNFTIAARELYITQPAVTAQVKLFEKYYELKLFKRQGKNLYLTDEGKVLYKYSKPIFEHEKEIEQAISEMKELNRGLLKLGTTKAYARYIMPSVISNFHKAYPYIKINLDEGSSMDMINSLLEFKNEVVVVAKAEENQHINYIPFSQEELIVILSVNHPLARKKEVYFSELSKEPVIMKEKGSGTRRKINALYSKNGYTPNIFMETGNNEFICNLVQRGEAISFLVKAGVEKKLKEKKLGSVSLIDQNISLDINFAYMKNQSLSPPANAFYKVLKRLHIDGTSPESIGSLIAKILAQQKQNV